MRIVLAFIEASRDLHADTTFVAAVSFSIMHSSNAHSSCVVQINLITRYGMRRYRFSSCEQCHDIMT